MLYRFIVLSAVLVAIVISVPANASIPTGNVNFLNVDFDNRTPDDILGAGGAQAGEPTSLPGLNGVIVERTPGDNFLQVDTHSNNTNARGLRWSFLNNAESTSGTVQISFRLKPHALDAYSFAVRENGTSSKDFLSVTFTGIGTFSARDKAGSISVTNATYAANTEMAVLIEFDMDAGTSQMKVNGLPVFSGRSHGIVDRGVGTLVTGYGSGHKASPFELDDLAVSGVVPLTLVLAADFDDKIVGAPIGTGGAEVGEPTKIDSDLQTKIIEPTAGNRILQLQKTVVGPARSTRWHFLDYLEIESGVVVFEVDLEFAVMGDYYVFIRESRLAASSFGTLNFYKNGGIQLTDAIGTAVNLPASSYNAGELYHLRMSYDLNSGTYSMTLGGTVLAADRAHGVSTGRGVGSIGFGVLNNADASASFAIDALQVGASDAAIFPSQLNFLAEPTSGRINESLTPVLEIGVVNIFDEKLEDGMLVEVSIEDGPTSATLSGASAPTVAGTARFENLQINQPGTYRLRVSTARARAISENDLVIPRVFDHIFKDGFEEEGPKKE